MVALFAVLKCTKATQLVELVNSNVALWRSPSQHQFWAHAPAEEEMVNKELLAESRSRYISFPGSFIPVSHFCRARLGNGLLCQRQDRLKVTGQTSGEQREYLSITAVLPSFYFSPAVSVSWSHYSSRCSRFTPQWGWPTEGGARGKKEEGRRAWWGTNVCMRITQKHALYACKLLLFSLH